MSAKRRYSLLHLQMGQEVIYLVLAASVITAFLLAVYVIELLQENRAMRTVVSTIAECPVQPAPVCPAPPTCPQLAIPQCPEPEPGADQPPIITMSEADGFFFESGSALITPEFESKLRAGIVEDLISIGESYDVDIIEVIGHTDEVPIRAEARISSNLDRQLIEWLNSDAVDSPLVAYDNVGLGMARAATVAKILADTRAGKTFTILVLSAGPTITTDEFLATGDGPNSAEERRRIEVRMRRRVR